MLVDTLSIRSEASAGIRNYLVRLLDAVPVSARRRIDLLCSRSNRKLFDELAGYGRRVLPWRTTRRPVRVITQQVMVPLYALAGSYRVVFEPADHAAVASLSPVVTTFHSSHLNLRWAQMDRLQAAYNRIILSLTAKKSRRIIAISNFVRQSLAEELDVGPDKVSVIHHGGGVVERARLRGWRPPAYEDRDGGILFVSTLYPHKGADRLLGAYQTLKQREEPPPPRLLIVGRSAHGERRRLEGFANDLGISADVDFLGRIDDERLLDLLASSRLMAFPSFIEGFGLPAVEAMQAGLPLVTSNRTSLPEVVGSAAVCVDPNDTDELADAMYRVLNEEGLGRRLAESALKRGNRFSWKRCARETLDLLIEVGTTGREMGKTRNVE